MNPKGSRVFGHHKAPPRNQDRERLVDRDWTRTAIWGDCVKIAVKSRFEPSFFTSSVCRYNATFFGGRETKSLYPNKFPPP